MSLVSSDSDLSEHLARTRFFLEQSKAQTDAEKRSRFLMASIYPARAVIEIIIDRIKRGRLKGDFRDFLAEAAAVVRYFKAIEYLRDHDFHRNAIQFIPGRQSLYGPIKLGTGNSPQGAAAMGGRPGEPMEESTAKTGYVKQMGRAIVLLVIALLPGCAGYTLGPIPPSFMKIGTKTAESGQTVAERRLHAWVDSRPGRFCEIGAPPPHRWEELIQPCVL